jgi:hypothetical protein
LVAAFYTLRLRLFFWPPSSLLWRDNHGMPVILRIGHRSVSGTDCRMHYYPRIEALEEKGE